MANRTDISGRAMLTMRPIPKKLLIHTVKLHKRINEDAWGKGQLDAGVELSSVRMEPSSQIVRDKNNAELRLSAVLFFDCRNSEPRGMKFTSDNVDDIVIFNGEKHMIKAVEPLYDERKLHHYELGLIKGA